MRVNRYLTAAVSDDLVETIHHGFNRAVTKWPSRIAIIADDGSLSFAELAAACLGVCIDLLNLKRQSGHQEIIVKEREPKDQLWWIQVRGEA